MFENVVGAMGTGDGSVYGKTGDVGTGFSSEV